MVSFKRASTVISLVTRPDRQGLWLDAEVLSRLTTVQQIVALLHFFRSLNWPFSSMSRHLIT
jgi:hypothetical protein